MKIAFCRLCPFSHWFLSISHCLALLFLAFPVAHAEETEPYSSVLMFINPDGTNLRPFISFGRDKCGSPQWSPDGKQIAYDTWKEGGTFEDAVIEIVDVQNLNKRSLGKGAMPSWSPDGKQIVCHTYDTPQREIVVMDTEGNVRDEIMGHWGSPRWSPVGNRIITANNNFMGGLSVFDVASRKEKVIAQGNRAWQGLSISPDGRSVFFGGISGGVFLATLNDDATSATTKQIASTGNAYHSCWSPDGKKVVFNWQPAPELIPQLYLYDVDENRPLQPFPGQDTTRDNRDPAWSPDGKTIVFVSSGVGLP